MPKNSINLIQVENTREGIEKLADLLLIATENMTYIQYKLSTQMFKDVSDVIEIRFGDCVEYASRIIMEADARRETGCCSGLQKYRLHRCGLFY